MKWERINANGIIAKGENGNFIINKKRGCYYGKYIGKEKMFNIPASNRIKELKKMCEENFYWEGLEK